MNRECCYFSRPMAVQARQVPRNTQWQQADGHNILPWPLMWLLFCYLCSHLKSQICRLQTAHTCHSWFAVSLIKLSEDQRSIHFISHRLYFRSRHIKGGAWMFPGYSQAKINVTSFHLLEAFSNRLHTVNPYICLCKDRKIKLLWDTVNAKCKPRLKNSNNLRK